MGKQPETPVSQPPSRLPDWLKSATGRLACAFGAAAFLIHVAALAVEAWIPALDPAARVAALGACVLAGIGAIRVVRDRRMQPGLKRAAKWMLGAFTIVAAANVLQLSVRFSMTTVGLSDGHVRVGVTMAVLALVIGGITGLPKRRIDRDGWIAALLDLVTVMLTGFLAFWLFALNPALGNGEKSLVVLVALIALTALSLVLLGSMLLVFFRRHDAVTHAVLAPLATGVLLLLAAEVLPLTHAFATTGAASGWATSGWALFAVCAAVSMHAAGREAESQRRPSKNAIMAVPYAATGLVGLLLVTSLISRDLWMENSLVLLPSVFLALVLVVIRQTRIARDKLKMAEEMWHAKEIAESANNSRLHFLANISHDLRTPLNGILGCAQILLRDTTITPKQRELLKTSQGCAEHLRTLINDLLDLSKLESGKLELAPVDFDLHALLAEIEGTFRLQAENKNILLEIDTGNDVPKWVHADRRRVQQILGNLVHNAVKFTDRGAVTVRARSSADRLTFQIKDTGCGILPDRIGDLFKPFHVVDEKSIQLEGTGLGLSISKKLAENMDGDVSVQSIYGKGTTFTLDLPLQEGAPVIEAQRTAVDYQGHRRRILIVDDNPANRIILRSMIEPLDFLVMEAAGGAEALEQLEFAKPDIFILDLMMPEMDGFELCRRIHALKLATPPVCIALSAMAGEDVPDRCRAAGFRDLLRKPLNLELLLESLHTHAGIEWVYGLLKPAPKPGRAGNEEARPMKLPPRDVLDPLTDLARRGTIKHIEARLAEPALSSPEFEVFVERVRRYLSDFKVKELADWLSSQTPALIHDRN